MSTLIKHAGVWKEPGMIYVKDQDIWKEVGRGKIPIPQVGEPFGGGFALAVVPDAYQGLTVLVIADKSAETSLPWKTVTGSTPGTTGLMYGWDNTNAMNDAQHPAAQYCRNYRGGGFDNWYLPARGELDFFWQNISPGNPDTPEPFKTGGAQALEATTITYYWSSTEQSANNAWHQRFTDGRNQNGNKTASRLLRPVRRVKI